MKNETCNENGSGSVNGNSKDDVFPSVLNEKDEEIKDGTESYSSKNACIPKDHGWAWFVLLGASLEMVLLVGIIKSSGILFVAFQDKFYSSSSMTSLLSTVQNICQSIMALFVMTIGVRFTTCRNLLFAGSIITGIAFIVTSQAEDIRILLFSHGVLQGIGAGFMQPTALNMVGLYFEKRRGLANSIAVSGGSFGGLIFAPMITKLLSTYGYQGCVLILGGVLLNGCVSGALFRPASFYINQMRGKTQLIKTEKRDNSIRTLISSTDATSELCKSSYFGKRTTLSNTNMLFRENSLMISSSDCHKCADLCKSSTNRSMTKISQNHRTNSADDVWQKRKRKRTSFRNVQNDMKPSSSKTHLSTPILFCSDIKSMEIYTKPCAEKSLSFIDGGTSSEVFHKHFDMKSNGQRDAKKTEQVSKINLLSHTLSEVFNLKLLKNPVFLAFLVQGSLVCSGTILAPIFIAPHARDIGVSAEDVATLVTLLSCIDLFSRIFIGYISDKRWFRRSMIVAIATVCVSISASLLRFCTNFTTLLGYTITQGLVSGVYFALWPVVIVDYLTLANFQTCLGFMALVHGFSVAGAFYLVGYLRDISGSYVLPHYVIGGTTGLGAVILFSLPVIDRK